MKCVRCQAEIPEGARFCHACGESLVMLSEGGAPTLPSASGPTEAATRLSDGRAETVAGVLGPVQGFQRGARLMDGRYEIVCELGRGGMGVVYQAIDHARNDDIAIKMVPPELRNDERAILNLKHEVNTALKLTHEHICRIYDFQQCPEGHFITMELIDGASLERHLVARLRRGEGGFPLEQVLQWLVPICEALRYAHGKGVVHRDLKPGNVLVTRQGVVKLTDFGLARAIHSSMSKYSREAASGTLLYMSAEQCLGKPADARSDIYSLAMTVYELLSGQAPFADAADITYCQLHEDLEPIAELPDSVNAALARATRKPKEDRFAAVQDFLAAMTSKEPDRPMFKSVTASKQADAKPGQFRAGEVRKFDGMEFVWIPPGDFLMGSPDSEKDRSTNEGPQHRVTLSRGFWMGKYEVTQAQWQSVTGSNPSQFKGPDRPVECVSWDDCQAFITKLNAKVDAQYRLPTEAEWEYACRAGATSAYSFGDDAARLGEYAWYDGNSKKQTQPVSRKKPNMWGLYDMHGNVWEWCQDWWHDNYQDAASDGSAWESPAGQYRVLRGGSWYSPPGSCRSAFRRFLAFSESRFSYVSFRLALSAAAPA